MTGWRGEIDDPIALKARVEHDLHYIENWSINLDLYILAVTPFRLLDTRLLMDAVAVADARAMPRFPLISKHLRSAQLRTTNTPVKSPASLTLDKRTAKARHGAPAGVSPATMSLGNKKPDDSVRQRLHRRHQSRRAYADPPVPSPATTRFTGSRPALGDGPDPRRHHHRCLDVAVHPRDLVAPRCAIGRSLDARRAFAELQQAVALRCPLPGCIVHTNRGWQYANW